MMEPRGTKSSPSTPTRSCSLQMATTIHAPEQTSNFALVSAGLLRKIDKHLLPSKTVEVRRAHVSQQQNHRFSPCNWLSPVIGGLLKIDLHDQSTAVERLVFVSSHFGLRHVKVKASIVFAVSSASLSNGQDSGLTWKFLQDGCR